MKGHFVSRGGEKLCFALDHFKVSVDGLVAADFGSSTGGFVDCLLQKGAKKVFSVDTSYGELAYTLRVDSRVVVMERTNALNVALPEQVDFISIDTSWTKQKNILPHALKSIKKGGVIISLLKPQYEAKPGQLTKGVAEEKFLPEIIENVKQEVGQIDGLILKGIVESPIKGLKGKNTEFLLFMLVA